MATLSAAALRCPKHFQLSVKKPRFYSSPHCPTGIASSLKNPSLFSAKTFQKTSLQQNKFDLIIIVDTNSNSQLPVFEEYLKQTDTPVLVIDHHATSDSLGDVELVDTTASAACSVVFDLFRFAHWPITPKIAQALFAGIATDTGWFHFNNTTSRCLRDCADLIDAGANPARYLSPHIPDLLTSAF